jgi:DNA-binding winged helix-turn-helix (wHTH) protein/TolB-like protein
MQRIPAHHLANIRFHTHFSFRLSGLYAVAWSNDREEVTDARNSGALCELLQWQGADFCVTFLFHCKTCSVSISLRGVINSYSKRLLGVAVMSTPSQSSRKIHFGEFELNLDTAELRSNGSKAMLPGQPFQVLLTLLDHPGQLVTREELKKRLWPSDTFVDFDQSLNKAVNRLREALRDSAEQPRFIETLPRKGYRFIAVVEDGHFPTGSECYPALESPREKQSGETPHPPWFLHLRRTLRYVFPLLICALGVGWFALRDSANPTTVAILPFQNMSADTAADFLSLALPDEIATALSYAHSLSVRPFATTSKYVVSGLDIRQAGQEMRVTDIVIGHYLKEGDRLQITLEAVDVENNRTVWRDTLDVAAPDMIAMRRQITAKVRQGLIPALAAGGESAESATQPKNEEAYDLYLRSVSMPHDAAANRAAIAMLERAVGLDPTYAPAWGALGLRCYYDHQYSTGGEAMYQRSNAALERALALDSNLASAAGNLIINRLEKGNLIQAYWDAADLLKRQPGNAAAHFSYGVVLRYAGLLEESARECEAALSLDPGNYLWRSCSTTFALMGDPQRAMDFVRLDSGSAWAGRNVVRTLLREGKVSEAREAARSLDHSHTAIGTFQTCLESPSSPEVSKAIRETEPLMLANPDPEVRYLVAADFAFCNQKGFTVKLLKMAIDGHYCAYVALQKDPLLASLRSAPEFSQLLSDAKHCQDTFLAGTTQVSR